MIDGSGVFHQILVKLHLKKNFTTNTCITRCFNPFLKRMKNNPINFLFLYLNENL